MKTIPKTYDISSGAERTGYRLHQGLQGVGINSTIPVKYQSSNDS